jgi:hypothetical protein
MLAISQKLLDGQFAAEDAVATPEPFRYAGTEETTHYIEWGEGVSAGEITIETAPKPAYDGTWAPVATVTFDGSVTPAPKQEYVRVQGQYGAMRHRISSVVLDGTVTTRIEGSC